MADRVAERVVPLKAHYRRVLLKISGEALMGPQEFGLDQDTVARIDVSKPWHERWNLDWLGDWFNSSSFRPFSMSSLQWVAWLAVAVLIGIELMLNAANLNLVAFDRFGPAQVRGQIFALLVLAIAAAEAAVALAIILTVFDSRDRIDVDEVKDLKG